MLGFWSNLFLITMPLLFTDLSLHMIGHNPAMVSVQSTRMQDGNLTILGCIVRMAWPSYDL
jgi:hypothetical protein